MLSKGLKDEANQKLNELIGKMTEIEFVPDLWEREQRQRIDDKLQEILSFGLQDIESMNSESLIEKLKAQDFDFSNFEQFGDLLLKIIPLEAEIYESHLATSAVAIFEYIQKESKTFSFSIIQKINQAKALV